MYENEIKIRNDVTVELIQHCGSDSMIAAAARVSTKGALSLPKTDDYEGHEKDAGLIRYLMAHKHGTPFEHNMMTFFISAPIFVFREFHRHRVGWSYNEESGRYRELQPVFYIPSIARPKIVQKPGGKPGHYEYVDATEHQYGAVVKMHQRAFELAYSNYKALLMSGIAKEVARACLPVAIYSSMYATCNARSMMNFLSLRTSAEHANHPSKPQREIEMVAEAMEWEFSRLFPATFKAFDDNGREAP